LFEVRLETLFNYLPLFFTLVSMILIALVESFSKTYKPPSKVMTIEKQNSAGKRISEIITIGPLFVIPFELVTTEDHSA